MISQSGSINSHATRDGCDLKSRGDDRPPKSPAFVSSSPQKLPTTLPSFPYSTGVIPFPYCVPSPLQTTSLPRLPPTHPRREFPTAALIDNAPRRQLSLPTTVPYLRTTPDFRSDQDRGLPTKPEVMCFPYESASVLSFLHVLLSPFSVLRLPTTTTLRLSFWLFLVLLCHSLCCLLFPFVPPRSRRPCDLSSSSLPLVLIFLVALFPTRPTAFRLSLDILLS